MPSLARRWHNRPNETRARASSARKAFFSKVSSLSCSVDKLCSQFGANSVVEQVILKAKNIFKHVAGKKAENSSKKVIYSSAFFHTTLAVRICLDAALQSMDSVECSYHCLLPLLFLFLSKFSPSTRNGPQLPATAQPAVHPEPNHSPVKPSAARPSHSPVTAQ